MSATSRSTDSTPLSLAAADQWVLHHVLLDRIERARGNDGTPGEDAPPIALYRAFERLDAGTASFGADELAAMQNVLAAYQCATDEWELERAAIERLLREVSTALESGASAVA